MHLHDIVFVLFNVYVLGTISLLLAAGNLNKYRIARGTVMEVSRDIYVVRAWNFAMIGMAFFLFPAMPTLDGRALLRFAIGFLLICEFLYHWYYIKGALYRIVQWTRKSSR